MFGFPSAEPTSSSRLAEFCNEAQNDLIFLQIPPVESSPCEHERLSVAEALLQLLHRYVKRSVSGQRSAAILTPSAPRDWYRQARRCSSVPAVESPVPTRFRLNNLCHVSQNIVAASGADRLTGSNFESACGLRA